MLIAHKFGGTSVLDASRIRHVADLLLARTGERQVVVVSAMKGVTDTLLQLVARAATGDASWPVQLETLAARHHDAARALVPDGAELVAELDRAFESLRSILRAQEAIGALSDDLSELVAGLGEVWSSRILAAHLASRGEEALWLDARDLVVVDKDMLGAHVDWTLSTAALTKALRGRTYQRLIVPGFVARDRRGRITTLGRNGSDYSGAIFGALCEAAEIHIWTDVDGVLSADPRHVPEAVLLGEMSYSEACELAYFGAKVIHPQTMAPAITRNIPIVIRNTFAPEKPGTRITARGDASQPIKGVTTFSSLAILNVEGAGMIGVPGTAERAFGALREAGVSVVMISQGSSEHSICVVVDEHKAASGREALLRAFAREVGSGQILDVTAETGISALAVVGDGMAGSPGVAARLFTALARSGVNVRAIAQGASERNISIAIDSNDAPRALRAVHAGFYLSAQTLSVGIIGIGNVGAALLRQLEAARARLLATHGLDLRISGIATSKQMLLLDHAQDDGALPAMLRAQGQVLDLDAFVQHIKPEHLPHAVLIDCTASDDPPSHYAAWLARGIHVLTANKQAGAGPLDRYERIARARRGIARFLYEATVGAGLPIVQTLRDLLDTGDDLVAIEGIFSGTLAYIFNMFDGSLPFSELVRKAKALGYTEPDPRDDLSGLDVARKLVILGREAGLKLSVADVALEGLVPGALLGLPTPRFMERLGELDAPMAEKLDLATRRGCKLRYVARLDASGAASVGLTEVSVDHAFSHIKLTDNVVQFTTRRYASNPLVVQGPGAGPDVTAAGVFADLLRVASALGAPL
ncbi:MAG: bifunctional aspartate kinase/homoserine dehydrogenase I [Polyangia bacterium]